MATGINVGVNKQLAFVISTALAGLAGGLYAPNIGFLGPAVANVPTTFNMLLFLLVGGLGSLSGPLVGSLLVATLTQFLQQFQEYQLIVFGPLLVLVVIFFPQGIAGLLHRGETWFRNRGTGTDNGQSEEPAAEESRVEPTKEVR